MFIDKPGERESQLAQGAQPVIAQINGDSVAVYQAGSNVVMKRGKDSAPTMLSAGSFPSLASSPDGREGFLVWDHTDGAVGTPQYVVIH